MQRLYAEHGFEAKLLTCPSIVIPQHDAGTIGRIMHEGFCCKKKTAQYFDPITGDEIAVVSQVTPTPPNLSTPYLLISRLRIENIIYQASIFDA